MVPNRHLFYFLLWFTIWIACAKVAIKLIVCNLLPQNSKIISRHIFLCYQQESNEKLQQLKKDQLAYQTVRTQFLEYLQLVYEKLRTCSEPANDFASLERKISTIKVILVCRYFLHRFITRRPLIICIQNINCIVDLTVLLINRKLQVAWKEAYSNWTSRAIWVNGSSRGHLPRVRPRSIRKLLTWNVIGRKWTRTLVFATAS